MAKSKAKVTKIFKRYGASDFLIGIDEEISEVNTEDVGLYFIGYEDEDGDECKEDGTYLE